jgi:SAM-dependent methyltransferase
MFDTSTFHNIPVAISGFMKMPIAQVLTRLGRGFWNNHVDATVDFVESGADPTNRESLINWYKQTDSYIWELGAWHWGDRGKGITAENKEVFDACVGKVQDVLVLGDGIGTMSMQLKERGVNPTYNDLAGSRTAAFAQYRFQNSIPVLLTDDFEPRLGPPEQFDAVVAHAFFEHIPNIPDWLTAIHGILRPNGLLFVRNDWITGTSADQRTVAIPMHLESNLEVGREWHSLVPQYGFDLVQGGHNEIEHWRKVA